jgi:DNA-binding NtrC family response regulator
MDDRDYKHEESTELEDGTSAAAPSPLPFKEAKELLVNAFEREYLEQLIRRCGANVSRASREAGIDRVYVRKLFKKHNLTPASASPNGQV